MISIWRIGFLALKPHCNIAIFILQSGAFDLTRSLSVQKGRLLEYVVSVVLVSVYKCESYFVVAPVIFQSKVMLLSKSVALTFMSIEMFRAE